MNIIAGMTVCGHDTYYKCAHIAIKSFLRECKSVPLVVFTDRPDEYNYLNNVGDLRLVDFNKEMLKHHEIMHSLVDRTNKKMLQMPYFNYQHHQVYATALIPFLEFYARENNFAWCQRIDCDAYFLGDLFQVLREEVGEWAQWKHFFMVERIHPAMQEFDKAGIPGAGFCLWQANGKFWERFYELFKNNEQNTIWGLMKDGRHLVHCRLLRPGYHFVYPFRENGRFSKEDACRFAPAYFHLTGPKVYENLLKMEGWFHG